LNHARKSGKTLPKDYNKFSRFVQTYFFVLRAVFPFFVFAEVFFPVV
jgi:hypothetical protein